MSNRPILRFRKYADSTPDLRYAHYGDSALDLYSRSEILVWPFQTVMIPTGIYLDIPEGYEVQVRPRSSMSKAGWIQNIGTVDNRYTGEVQVVLYNGSLLPRRIRCGQKIAQMAVCPVAYCRVIRLDGSMSWSVVEPTPFSESEIPQPGPESVRGDRGFGSTGQ